MSSALNVQEQMIRRQVQSGYGKRYLRLYLSSPRHWTPYDNIVRYAVLSGDIVLETISTRFDCSRTGPSAISPQSAVLSATV